MSTVDIVVIRLCGEPARLHIGRRSLKAGSSSLNIVTGTDDDWQVCRLPVVQFGDETGEEGTPT